jgi:hypothetical protein
MHKTPAECIISGLTPKETKMKKIREHPNKGIIKIIILKWSADS